MYIHTSICTYIHIDTNTHIYIHPQYYMCARRYIHTRTCVYTIYTCTYTHVYIHTYIDTYSTSYIHVINCFLTGI